jgi:hypothetical protein
MGERSRCGRGGVWAYREGTLGESACRSGSGCMGRCGTQVARVAGIPCGSGSVLAQRSVGVGQTVLYQCSCRGGTQFPVHYTFPAPRCSSHEELWKDKVHGGVNADQRQ